MRDMREDKPSLADEVREGTWNLVHSCAEVKAGESVLLLNEHGKVDPQVVSLIEKLIRESGAECHSLWGQSIDRGRSNLPKILIGALLSADKVFLNYALNRVVLYEYVRNRKVIRITNRCRTPELMASAHARFPWGMVRAIYTRLEEIFAAGKSWRITSPQGTNISGKIGGSEIANAYFLQEAEQNRFDQYFPGAVYVPVGSVQASGVIMVDHAGMDDKTLWEEPVTIVVEKDRVVNVKGGRRATELRQLLEEKVRTHGDKANILDSWHGGIHPKAEKRPGAVSETVTMHFHLGRVVDPYSASISDQTVEVDQKKIYENGRLMIFDDPKLRMAAERYVIKDWLY